MSNIPSTRLRFYPLIAIALAVFIIIGFSRTYYLRFLFDLPPMRTVMQLHGLVFTAWLALFVTQTQLIASHRVDLHRTLGMVGVFLTILVVVAGLAAMLVSAATPRLSQLGLTAPQASIVPFVATTQFTVLVAAGIALRRRADLHKRFMLLAMISVISPAVARITALFGLREYLLVMQMGVIAAFVACCLAYDWRKSGVVHPVFAVGGVVLVLMWPLRYAVARTGMWQPIGDWFAEAGRHLLQ